MHTRRRRTHRLATFWLDCNCRHAAHGDKSHSRCQPIHRLRKTAGAIQRASNLRLECSKMYCPLEDMESQHTADSVRWVQCLRACVNCTRRIGNCPLQHDRPERDSAARKPCHVLCFPSSAAGHCWPVSRRCGSCLRRRRPPCRGPAVGRRPGRIRLVPSSAAGHSWPESRRCGRRLRRRWPPR